MVLTAEILNTDTSYKKLRFNIVNLNFYLNYILLSTKQNCRVLESLYQETPKTSTYKDTLNYIRLPSYRLARKSL
jgi:hypothetical protein